MANPNPTHKFQPGEVTNPNGRPKREWTWAGLIEDSMEEEDETGVPYKLIVARKLRQLAKTGDMVAIKEVFNRTDGMPTQPTVVTGKDGKDLFGSEISEEKLLDLIKRATTGGPSSPRTDTPQS